MSQVRLLLREIRHPHHIDMEHDWRKFRLAFQGGRIFKDEFLEKFNSRETNADFCIRSRISYVPAHAKAAITDIRNSIFQRMIDITREGGPQTYQDAINGLLQGVDGRGNTMNGYIGRIILEELLVLGRVGIYIDKPRLNQDVTLAEQRNISPYLYHYQAEDIFSWSFDHTNALTVVLLRDHAHKFDDATGLITGMQERFRLLKRVWVDGEPKVTLQLFKYDDTHHSRHRHGFHVNGKAPGLKLIPDGPPLFMDIPEIPFVILDLSTSLMTDIADYQISLLNMASSDVSYVLKSNFPFYTEQYSQMAALAHIRQPGDAGTATEAGVSNSKEIQLGIAQGRQYPQDMDRPGFIHPSSEPLKASMEKQQQLKTEIRQLVNLNIQNLQPKQSEVEEGEKVDHTSLEAGLSYIGLELEAAERQIAKIWAAYEGFLDEIAVNYPNNYNLRTDADRRLEADQLIKLRSTLPSKTFQLRVSKKAAEILIGHEVTEEELATINSELEGQEVFSTDPDTIKTDLEMGLVSADTASKARGYPEGEADKAKKDRMERIAVTAAAQSSVSSHTPLADLGARGLPNPDTDPSESAVAEKTKSQTADIQDTPRRAVRGRGRRVRS